MDLDITLTERLKVIAQQVKKNAKFADIGTDHAHLPIYLIKNNIVSCAIACDIKSGPLEKAKENIEKYEVQNKISLRLGAGLEKVRPFECDTISIAGMGGQNISQILSDAKWTNNNKYTLILQPMTMIYYLRKWLYENGYNIKKECICKEGKRTYIILIVNGNGFVKKLNIYDCCISKPLLNAQGAKEYLTKLLKKEELILQNIKNSKNKDNNRLYIQYKIVENIKNSLEEI